MNINISCEISLSKKLRNILRDGGGTITLTSSSLNNGVGKGTLIISGDNLDINTLNQSLMKETSIQLTPTIFEMDVPSEYSHANIFSSTQLEKNPTKRTIVDKIAATNAPEKGQQAYSIKTKEEIAVPEEFEEYESNEFQKWISDFNELMEATKKAKNKKSNIDIDSIINPREKAMAIEQKEKDEAIDYPAFIVNDTCKSITLNDMDISLSLNSPFNLRNISAKRIAKSNDLREMINKGFIKFVSPEKAQEYISSTNEIYSDTLSVGSVDELLGEEGMDIEDDDYEETQFYKSSSNDHNKLAGLINLTGGSLNAPASSLPNKNISNKSTSNSKGIKTISRK